MAGGILMFWRADPNHPATPKPVKPETVEYSFLDMNLFKDSITWTRGDQSYFRTTCVVCGHKMGTCRGKVRFMELKVNHRLTCPAPCGFLDCADCTKPEAACSCDFHGGFIVQCAACEAKPKPWAVYNAV